MYASRPLHQRSLFALLGTALTLSLVGCGHGDNIPEENMVAQAKQDENAKTKRGLEPVEIPNDMTLRVRDQHKVGGASSEGQGSAQAASPWTYEGALGPNNWGAISKQYATCAEGKQQSPVDLKWRRPTETAAVQFAYRQDSLTAENTGHFVRLGFSEPQIATINGEQYQLRELRFHAPSEHMFSGRELPVEIALVHQNAKGQKAIISVMLTEGKANETLSKILPHIPSAKQERKVAAQQAFHPIGLMPVNYNHYRYEGSESIPPCEEGVIRIVFNTPVEASAEQLGKIQSFYFGNRRNVQPIEAQNVQLFFGQ